MDNKSDLLVFAHILNPKTDKKCEFIRDGAMWLTLKKTKAEKKYVIKAIGKASVVTKKIKSGFQVLDYSGHVIIPSFFDMHFHWVQDHVREMPKSNLLKWLELYTFPSERKFQSSQYSAKEAKYFFKRLSSVGTLGGACFSSIHENALEHAMENVVGDFVIGNALMTMNSPKYLTQTKASALKLVRKFSKKYKKRYALTPRFAIATDPETMKEASKIAKSHGCFMQSHLCETQNEIDFVTKMYREFPGFTRVKNYTEIYKKVGMLGAKSLMAHGIHLSKDELEMLGKTKTTLIHCPTSNAPVKQKGLGSGLFNFKQVEKYKIRWALGSDIGAGPILSMFDVIRSFVDQNTKDKIKGATYTKALYRATLAGAEILQLDKRCGNLDVGKEANFLVLPKIKMSAQSTVETVMKQYVKTGQSNRKKYDNLLEKVFYRGELLHSKS